MPEWNFGLSFISSLIESTSKIERNGSGLVRVREELVVVLGPPWNFITFSRESLFVHRNI